MIETTRDYYRKFQSCTELTLRTMTHKTHATTTREDQTRIFRISILIAFAFGNLTKLHRLYYTEASHTAPKSRKLGSNISLIYPKNCGVIFILLWTEQAKGPLQYESTHTISQMHRPDLVIQASQLTILQCSSHGVFSHPPNRRRDGDPNGHLTEILRRICFSCDTNQPMPSGCRSANIIFWQFPRSHYFAKPLCPQY